MKKLFILSVAVLMTFLACNGSTLETGVWADGKIYAGAEEGSGSDTTKTLYVRFDENDIYVGYDLNDMEGKIASYNNQIETIEKNATKWRIVGYFVDDVLYGTDKLLTIDLTVEKKDNGTIAYIEEIRYKFDGFEPGTELPWHKATLTEYTSTV